MAWIAAVEQHAADAAVDDIGEVLIERTSSSGAAVRAAPAVALAGGRGISAPAPQRLSSEAIPGCPWPAERRWAVRPRESVNDRRAPRRMSRRRPRVGAPCHAAWCRGVNQAVPPGRHQLTSTARAGRRTARTPSPVAHLGRVGERCPADHDVVGQQARIEHSVPYQWSTGWDFFIFRHGAPLH